MFEKFVLRLFHLARLARFGRFGGDNCAATGGVLRVGEQRRSREQYNQSLLWYARFLIQHIFHEVDRLDCLGYLVMICRGL